MNMLPAPAFSARRIFANLSWSKGHLRPRQRVLMSASVNPRRFDDVRVMSAFPLIATE
jgi:hypothetical protein